MSTIRSQFCADAPQCSILSHPFQRNPNHSNRYVKSVSITAREIIWRSMKVSMYSNQKECPKATSYLFVCLMLLLVNPRGKIGHTVFGCYYILDKHTAVLQYYRISPMNGITIDENSQHGLSWVDVSRCFMDEVSFGAVPGRELCAGAGG